MLRFGTIRTVPSMEMNVDVQVDLVKKIMRYFIDTWNLNAGKRYNHVDVTLSKSDDRNYLVEVTNYERCRFEASKFLSIVSNCGIPATLGARQQLVALVYSKSADSEEDDVYELVSQKTGLSLKERDSRARDVKFPSWKEYLSINLQCTLSTRHADAFGEIVLSQIAALRLANPNVKFTYCVDKKMIHNNYVRLDDDYKSCKVLSTALSNVIKHSLNSEFRDRCYELLNVSNTHQAQNSLMTRLLPMINGNYDFSRAQQESTASNTTQSG